MSMMPKCTCPGGPLIGMSRDCPAHGDLLAEKGDLCLHTENGEHEWDGGRIGEEPIKSDRGNNVHDISEVVGSRPIIGWTCQQCGETRPMTQDEYFQWRLREREKDEERDHKNRLTLRVREIDLAITSARNTISRYEHEKKTLLCEIETGHDMVSGPDQFTDVCRHCGIPEAHDERGDL